MCFACLRRRGDDQRQDQREAAGEVVAARRSHSHMRYRGPEVDTDQREVEFHGRPFRGGWLGSTAMLPRGRAPTLCSSDPPPQVPRLALEPGHQRPKGPPQHVAHRGAGPVVVRHSTLPTRRADAGTEPTRGTQREGMRPQACESASGNSTCASALATLPRYSSPVGGPMGLGYPAAAGPASDQRSGLRHRRPDSPRQGDNDQRRLKAGRWPQTARSERSKSKHNAGAAPGPLHPCLLTPLAPAYPGAAFLPGGGVGSPWASAWGFFFN